MAVYEVTFVAEQTETSSGIPDDSDGSFLLQGQRGCQCEDPEGDIELCLLVLLAQQH